MMIKEKKGYVKVYIFFLENSIFDKYLVNSSREKYFDSKKNEYLSNCDFNWNDHGIFVLSEIDKDKIEQIDTEIKTIINFTTGDLYDVKEKLDTKPLRVAIEKYVEKIMGINHEDYNYSIMNKLLDDDLKKYIKSVLFDLKLSKVELANLSIPFTSKELFQSLILVANLRQRICLTYLSKAFDEYLKEIN